MSLRAVRIGATLYFVLFALFVMWPVFVPFNHPLPLVFGLPFNMALIALWVAFSSVVLFVLDRSEEQHREAGDRAGGNRARGATARWATVRGATARRATERVARLVHRSDVRTARPLASGRARWNAGSSLRS